MQSESLDTSIDNICRTADNTADIVQFAIVCQFLVGACPWLSAMCYIQPLFEELIQ